MSEGVVNLLEDAAVEVGLAKSRRQQLTKICNYCRKQVNLSGFGSTLSVR